MVTKAYASRCRKQIQVSVHTTSEKSEYAPLDFYGQVYRTHKSVANQSQNGAICKRSSNGRNLKMSAFRFPVDGKHFENGSFTKTT